MCKELCVYAITTRNQLLRTSTNFMPFPSMHWGGAVASIPQSLLAHYAKIWNTASQLRIKLAHAPSTCRQSIYESITTWWKLYILTGWLLQESQDLGIYYLQLTSFRDWKFFISKVVPSFVIIADAKSWVAKPVIASDPPPPVFSALKRESGKLCYLPMLRHKFSSLSLRLLSSIWGIVCSREEKWVRLGLTRISIHPKPCVVTPKWTDNSTC